MVSRKKVGRMGLIRSPLSRAGLTAASCDGGSWLGLTATVGQQIVMLSITHIQNSKTIRI